MFFSCLTNGRYCTPLASAVFMAYIRKSREIGKKGLPLWFDLFW